MHIDGSELESVFQNSNWELKKSAGPKSFEKVSSISGGIPLPLGKATIRNRRCFPCAGRGSKITRSRFSPCPLIDCGDVRNATNHQKTTQPLGKWPAQRGLCRQWEFCFRSPETPAASESNACLLSPTVAKPQHVRSDNFICRPRPDSNALRCP